MYWVCEVDQLMRLNLKSSERECRSSWNLPSVKTFVLRRKKKRKYFDIKYMTFPLPGVWLYPDLYGCAYIMHNVKEHNANINIYIQYVETSSLVLTGKPETVKASYKWLVILTRNSIVNKMIKIWWKWHAHNYILASRL